ncbi:MAG: DNA mismatch repair endonuclease MutL [Treponema sp.]|nr:DNA mismatch repair endonuclease MutL [Treponema sp.]
MIRILKSEEAKKIAAGEVIDRPAALVREFIDNAIDSGASSIEVSIANGGSSKVEVIDNGSGMDKTDLELCILTHATSKIETLDDLSKSHTLGFRGEALAAAAAVSTLEILSSVDGREAYLLTAADGKSKIIQSRRVRGTSIRAFGLFDAIPARKRFLKREASEAAICKQIFMEKALAFPSINFRFIQDGKLKINALPHTEENMAVTKRFGELILSNQAFLHEIHAAGSGFTVCIVTGGPELFRQDRRGQYIFANRRRIQDFSLMQALEYGLAGFFPNGSHAIGAVFVDVDPALADFNIHPAKREVRFACASEIHHAITSALRDYTRRSGLAISSTTADEALENSPAFAFDGDRHKSGEYGDTRDRREAPGSKAGAAALAALLERKDEFAPSHALYAGETEAEYKTGESVTLAGRAFNLFIIVQKEERLFLIDQHAAHERLLYNHFLSKPITAQELLVPIPFVTESKEDDDFLSLKKEELKQLGILLKNEGNGNWLIDALPAGWGQGDTVQEILALRNAGGNMTEHWAATLACKAAIKDGGYLDDSAALALAKEALALQNDGSRPRCPHGRPLWMELTRDDLFRAVRRT